MPPTNNAFATDARPALTFSLSFVIDMRVGLLRRERSAPQQVRIEAAVVAHPTQWPVESIEATWNYQGLADLILALGQPEAEHIDLLETIVHRIATYLAADRNVNSFTISVAKPTVFGCGGSRVQLGPLDALSYNQLRGQPA